MANASRDTGHAIAQASRTSYHAAAAGMHEAGTSTWDLLTNSAIAIHNTPPESLTAPVIDIDPAMQARDWDQVTARYKSGSTVAGNIGFLYQPRPGQNLWRYGVIDMPLFLGNTALLPFSFARIAPWKPVLWKAASVEPTYTAAPPLPPE